MVISQDGKQSRVRLSQEDGMEKRFAVHIDRKNHHFWHAIGQVIQRSCFKFELFSIVSTCLDCSKLSMTDFKPFAKAFL